MQPFIMHALGTFPSHRMPQPSLVRITNFPFASHASSLTCAYYKHRAGTVEAVPIAALLGQRNSGHEFPPMEAALGVPLALRARQPNRLWLTRAGHCRRRAGTACQPRIGKLQKTTCCAGPLIRSTPRSTAPFLTDCSLAPAECQLASGPPTGSAGARCVGSSSSSMHKHARPAVLAAALPDYYRISPPRQLVPLSMWPCTTARIGFPTPTCSHNPQRYGSTAPPCSSICDPSLAAATHLLHAPTGSPKAPRAPSIGITIHIALH
jgi:hypothetical protein